MTVSWIFNRLKEEKESWFGYSIWIKEWSGLCLVFYWSREKEDWSYIMDNHGKESCIEIKYEHENAGIECKSSVSDQHYQSPESNYESPRNWTSQSAI